MVKCQAGIERGRSLLCESVAVDWRVHQECGIMDHNKIEPAPIGRAGLIKQLGTSSTMGLIDPIPSVIVEATVRERSRRQRLTP
jgi:hypothetical protein